MIRTATIVLVGLLLLLVAGGIPVDNGAQLVVFRTPVFRLLAACLALLCIAACARYGRSWRRLPFWLAHLGVVAILVGAGLGSVWAVRGRLVLPVAMPHSVDQLPTDAEGVFEPLGFALRISDFRADFYPPVYELYRPRIQAPQGAADYEHEARLPLRDDGTLANPSIGEIRRSQLWDAGRNDWVEQVALDDGRVLQRGHRTAKHFEARLQIRQGGVEADRLLRVNQPVAIAGWKIYLESYGDDPVQHVQLALRRDPGRIWAIVGIWLVVAGTALLCWRRRETAA
jgi:hypothetical protein